jgi:glutathione S-transferase
MWNRRAELGFFFPVAQCFRHSHPAMAALENPQIASWAEVNRPRVARIIGILDRQLASHPFIAGSSFSVADITALVAADFMKPARLAVPAEATNFRRWHEQMTARPSASA